MNKDYNRDQLYKYIGPPLRDSFVNELGEKRADEAIDIYRKYYFNKGIFETKIYGGMQELIKDLYKDGYKIYLATSKGEKSSERILKYFDILQYFSYISGSDNNKNTKKKVIEQLINENNLKVDESVMIGDRSYDIEASFELNLTSIAVSYGYGSYDEFKKASYIVDKPNQIKKIIKEML